MPANAKPVNSVTGVAQVGSAKAARNCPKRSKIATISTRVVSLNSAIKELTKPGSTSRNAWGQNTQPNTPQKAEPERHRALELPARDRLQATAHDLRHIGSRKQYD